MADDFEVLSKVVRSTEDVTYREMRKLALSPNTNLTRDQLRERLDAIADMIRLRDSGRATLRSFVDGKIDTDTALDQLKTQLQTLFGSWEDYLDCPDDDDLLPDPE